ncbi:copper transport outer membrane protein MctB [Krasilnikovia cinnamomea]|uniref:Copper transport outer membrane protein MctB n=1 Tax=Krasilnikovia cinnamomea TaxID=349313 RepID=A0A4Q7ZF08_9ACTN|nr:copper transporter [Krasilnikovia cinnamomea]RZU48884.1 copper transport outer membrane protein MctB [Krasilnikovia cinnamomea]
MINFRYHVVSLTAVFLALALGLVVGTAALNGPVADKLKDQVTTLSKDNGNYRSQANQYREELNRSQDFATEVAPALIGGKLTGRRLLVVALPGSQDYVDGVVTMLTVAGAKITAKVTVQDKFFDPANSLELLDLANRASQPTIGVARLPLNSDGVETSSALLALALQQRTPEVAPGDLTAVLAAYSGPGYIAVEDGAVGGAEATVVISGLPPVDKDAAKKSQSAVMLANQFVKEKPLVVAGNGSGDGNLVSEVRGDPTLVRRISTVDNASSVQGQLAAVLTVIERMTGGKIGQYGLAAGATSLVPKTAA